MSFDATDFLAGLFGDGSVAPAAVPSGEPTGDAPETPAFGPDDNPGGAPEAATSGDHAPATGGTTTGGEFSGSPDFTKWLLRSDARGRLGWEAPDLSEAERWWARADDTFQPPAPCPRCGSLELWQTLAGNWRCLRCDPPTTAIRVLEHVQRIRQRLKMPARPETAELLADLRRLTSTAARPRDPAAVARRGTIP